MRIICWNFWTVWWKYRRIFINWVKWSGNIDICSLPICHQWLQIAYIHWIPTHEFQMTMRVILYDLIESNFDTCYHCFISIQMNVLVTNSTLHCKWNAWFTVQCEPQRDIDCVLFVALNVGSSIFGCLFRLAMLLLFSSGWLTSTRDKITPSPYCFVIKHRARPQVFSLCFYEHWASDKHKSKHDEMRPNV